MPSCHLPLPFFLNTVPLCLGRSGTMHAGYWICIYASRAHGARYVKASKSLVSLNSTQLEEYNVHSMSASIIVLSLQYICALATTNKEEAEGINHYMCFTFMHVV